MIFYILNFNPRIPTLYKTMGPYYLQAQCNVQDTPPWEGKPHVHTRNITTPPWTAKTWVEWVHHEWISSARIPVELARCRSFVRRPLVKE